MKIAIFHDWIGAIGGGEKLILTLAREIHADVITTDINVESIRKIYATCKGHITTALDEDFGMTPVEAMASGKPVVAVREGGYLETVVDGVTGMLIEANEEGIINAVKLISLNPEKYKNGCMDRAKDFDMAVFIKEMKENIISVKSPEATDLK